MTILSDGQSPAARERGAGGWGSLSTLDSQGSCCPQIFASLDRIRLERFSELCNSDVPVCDGCIEEISVSDGVQNGSRDIFLSGRSSIEAITQRQLR